MNDTLTLLLTRRASGQTLEADEQAALEAALAEDPALIDLLMEAQAAAAGQTPRQGLFIWVQRASLSALFLGLFSLGLAVGTGPQVSNFFAGDDPTHARAELREQSSFLTRKVRKS